MELKAGFCSSLAKVFPGEPPETEITGASALRGERYSFQLAYTAENNRGSARIKVSSVLPVTVRKVELVPVRFCGCEFDDDIIDCRPGLYPDYLAQPDSRGEEFPLMLKQYRAAWFSVSIPENCPAGSYEIAVELTGRDYSGEEGVWRGSFRLEVIGAQLPELSLRYTCWLHGDCIASVYRTAVFSGRYWEILEKFVANAAAHGVNMLFTPLLTPPLDTEKGGERPTNQLVRIRRKDGAYEFDFSRVERFVNMARERGIRYFEIPPLFTQWGAEAAPKVVAENAETGEEERIFGWDTPAGDPEYREFLTALLGEFTAFLRRKKWDNDFFFHCSDEPSVEQLEKYADCQKFLQKVLTGFPVMDALSSVDFYRKHVIGTPVISESKVDEFIRNGITPEWIYYCCNPQKDFPNRFINMPSSRNRVMGMLLYRYDIRGFLHWGFNFYYTYLSKDVLDPFFSTDAGGNYPAGDPFLVYPGRNGEPEDSIRHEVFFEALQDLRALRLLERLTSREEVIHFLDSLVPGNGLKMNNYPKGEKSLLAIRREINARIKRIVMSPAS